MRTLPSAAFDHKTRLDLTRSPCSADTTYHALFRVTSSWAIAGQTVSYASMKTERITVASSAARGKPSHRPRLTPDDEGSKLRRGIVRFCPCC